MGVITRGTTNVNRLRRCDRWMVHHPTVQRCLSHASIHDAPLAIDVGYGASHTTTCEWAIWLRRLLIDASVPLTPIRRRVRDNLLTVPWSFVSGDQV